jgi:hypothetical protein
MAWALLLKRASASRPSGEWNHDDFDVFEDGAAVGADDLVLELLVAALLRRGERIVAQLVLDVLVLQAAQPLIGIGDLVEGLDHLGLELGLDRGKRERVLHIVVVEIVFGRATIRLRAAFERTLDANRILRAPQVCAWTYNAPLVRAGGNSAPSPPKPRTGPSALAG